MTDTLVKKDHTSELTVRLKRSRDNRERLLERLGQIPTSVLRLHRQGLSKKMFIYQHEEPGRNSSHQPGFEKKQEEMRAIRGPGYSGVSNRKNGRNTAAVSVMPAELVEFFVRYYAKPGAVYLDPFMGQGIRMQVAKILGLDYYGYDASAEFCRYLQAVQKKIDDGKTKIVTVQGDSRHPDQIPDLIGDFSFYSPPYWDIEYYGDEPEQLGLDTTYADFLRGMGEVALAWIPKFKPGAFHIVNLNDFRKDGVFYAYHADLLAVYRAAGWELTDVWIIEGLVGGMSKAFAVDFNMRKIAPKVHEYALVFRAPAMKDR